MLSIFLTFLILKQPAFHEVLKLLKGTVNVPTWSNGLKVSELMQRCSNIPWMLKKASAISLHDNSSSFLSPGDEISPTP